MTIQTSRLELVPLTLGQMRRWIRDPRGVARELSALPPEQSLMHRFSAGRIYRAKIGLIEQAPEHWRLATYFQMIRREDRQIVGELGFKGIARLGEAELGYGTYERYQNRGYMTEAVTALSDWALLQREVPLQRVTARTRQENYASQRVLQHSGFRRLYLDCGIVYWSKETAR